MKSAVKTKNSTSFVPAGTRQQNGIIFIYWLNIQPLQWTMKSFDRRWEGDGWTVVIVLSVSISRIKFTTRLKSVTKQNLSFIPLHQCTKVEEVYMFIWSIVHTFTHFWLKSVHRYYKNPTAPTTLQLQIRRA